MVGQDGTIIGKGSQGMSKLLDALRAWGADVDGGMERIYADEEFYTKCLKLVWNDTHFTALDHAMAAKNYQDAFTEAHTLKGVTGNLSLTPLYKTLSDLTEKLRTKLTSGVDPLYERVREQEAVFFQIMKDNEQR